MNKSIYKFVEQVITSKLPQVKYFGLFRNQFTNITNEREIDYPAVLLEISPIEFSQQGAYNQYSIATITLHVGMQLVNNVETGDKMIDSSFTILELLDDIDSYMAGAIGWDEEYSGTTSSNVSIGEVTRVNQAALTKVKSIWYGKITYSFPIVVSPKIYTQPKTITGVTISNLVTRVCKK